MTGQVAGKMRMGVVRVKFFHLEGVNVEGVNVEGVGVNGRVNVVGLGVRRLGVRKSSTIARANTLRNSRVYAIKGVNLGTGVWVPCATPRMVLVLRLR